MQQVPDWKQPVQVQGDNLIFIDVTDVITAVPAYRDVQASQGVNRLCYWVVDTNRSKENILITFFQLAHVIHNVDDIDQIF